MDVTVPHDDPTDTPIRCLNPVLMQRHSICGKLGGYAIAEAKVEERVVLMAPNRDKSVFQIYLEGEALVTSLRARVTAVGLYSAAVQTVEFNLDLTDHLL